MISICANALLTSGLSPVPPVIATASPFATSSGAITTLLTVDTVSTVPAVLEVLGPVVP